jgi:hypothetical protein
LSFVCSGVALERQCSVAATRAAALSRAARKLDRAARMRLNVALCLVLMCAACGHHQTGVPGGSDHVGMGGGSFGPVTGVATALPPLPTLTNVWGTVTGDSVKIHFDPVDGAKDYRVYVLPADGDVSAAGDGHVSVRNATYRCAGDRMAPAPSLDAVTQASSWMHTLVDNQPVDGYTRPLAEATLGYVFATPASDRKPVYALGDPGGNADNECYFGRWNESRVKKYVTSDSERAMLIAQRWRDDGIAFYVPLSGGVPVYVSENKGNRYFFSAAAEAQKRTSPTVAFNVLSNSTSDTLPLKRVFYQNNCGLSHDELVAGEARFQRAYHQGDQPLWDLHYSGLTGTTTLVIEALDDKCPWPGMLAPAASPAFSGGGGDYPEWITLAAAHAASATGEVFINGQGDGTSPKPIARAFVSVTPTPVSGLDWFEGFDKPLASFVDNPECGEPTHNCWQEFRQASSELDTLFLSVETTRHAFSEQLGELWTALADVGADVPGKFHMTVKKPAQMNDDTFLYVTMETDTFTTGRRYPQILISDRMAPVYWGIPSGHTLVIQNETDNTSSWPNQFQIEVCNERIWDVNQQCPAFHDVHENLDPNDSSKVVGLAPALEVGEHSGLDRATTWEVYASTKRVYLFLDGKAHGCADLPSGGGPAAGPVSVTFGHVLYHSAVDSMVGLSDFVMKHGQTESHRHFDNLGFKSGVAAPDWNEQLFPCARADQMSKGS